MRRAAWWSVVVVGCLLSAGTARASEADAGAFGLEVSSEAGARGCGDGEIVRARVAERVGRDPFAGVSGDRGRIEVSFARRESAWTATIVMVDASGARAGARTITHEGATCGPLVTSVVFTIAVLLEDLSPDGPGPEPARPEEPRAPPRAHDTPPPAERAEKAPAPSPGGGVRVDAVVGAVGALGSAPAPAVGAEALVGISGQRLRGELSARGHLPASSEGAAAVRARLVYARVAPCYGLEVISGCFVLAIGGVSGEATGERVASSRPEAQLYAGTGLGAVSRIFLGGDVFFLRASVDVLFSLARAGFDVGDQRVWTVPVVAAAGALGVGARLP